MCYTNVGIIIIITCIPIGNIVLTEVRFTIMRACLGQWAYCASFSTQCESCVQFKAKLLRGLISQSLSPKCNPSGGIIRPNNIPTKLGLHQFLIGTIVFFCTDRQTHTTKLQLSPGLVVTLNCHFSSFAGY